jgi:hypothetical protein
MKIAANPGMLVLGIWLILYGAVPLLKINFDGLPMLLNILAVVAGALLLMNK